MNFTLRKYPDKDQDEEIWDKSVWPTESEWMVLDSELELDKQWPPFSQGCCLLRMSWHDKVPHKKPVWFVLPYGKLETLLLHSFLKELITMF